MNNNPVTLDDIQIVVAIMFVSFLFLWAIAAGQKTKKQQEAAKMEELNKLDPQLKELKLMNEKLTSNEKKLSSIRWTVGIIAFVIGLVILLVFQPF